MKHAIRWGVILAVLVTIVNVGLIATGLGNNIFIGRIGALLVYVILNIAALVGGLLPTKSENGYKQQVICALVLGCVGAICIFLTSFLLQGVVFPDSIAEQNVAWGEAMSEMLPEEAMDAQMAALESRSAMGESFKGAIGTVVTSLVFGLLIAIFLRRKD